MATIQNWIWDLASHTILYSLKILNYCENNYREAMRVKISSYIADKSSQKRLYNFIGKKIIL